jgi:mono/diheme cytochrome c family protein
MAAPEALSAAIVTLLLAGNPGQAATTFYKDVLPILEQHCHACHRAGEIGPMPLITYAQARPWARAIREAVTLRKMPPWFADPHFGRFANDPSLSPAEIAAIQSWADSGAPEGRKEDAPPPVEWPAGGVTSSPDLVAGMKQPVTVRANTTVDYQYVILNPGFPVDRWVNAVEIRPGDRSVVHHAVLYVREPKSPWLRDVAAGVIYAPPANDRKAVSAAAGTTSDILAIYTPGAPVMQCPAGMAKKIPADSDLVLQMHYTSKRTTVNDRTEIRIVFAKDPPRSRVLTLQMTKYDFRIPPGARNYRVTVAGTLPRDALLLSLFPHMHLRGSGFEYQVLGTHGRVDTLLKVNRYNFYWQLTYRLKTPLLLRAGTRLLWTGYFDNSADNPLNPDPSAEVTWGEQSREEMMVGFFEVAVPPELDKPAFFVRETVGK